MDGRFRTTVSLRERCTHELRKRCRPTARLVRVSPQSRSARASASRLGASDSCLRGQRECDARSIEQHLDPPVLPDSAHRLRAAARPPRDARCAADGLRPYSSRSIPLQTSSRWGAARTRLRAKGGAPPRTPFGLDRAGRRPFASIGPNRTETLLIVYRSPRCSASVRRPGSSRASAPILPSSTARRSAASGRLYFPPHAAARRERRDRRVEPLHAFFPLAVRLVTDAVRKLRAPFGPGIAETDRRSPSASAISRGRAFVETRSSDGLERRQRRSAP